jgi:hypothetical protein
VPGRDPSTVTGHLSDVRAPLDGFPADVNHQLRKELASIAIHVFLALRQESKPCIHVHHK